MPTTLMHPDAPPTATAAASCAACASGPGALLSRHAVSTGWVSYHRCPACAAVRVVQTPRITWLG